MGGRAVRMLMKLLYAARIARPDLLRAINVLGCWCHKWDEECKLDMERLVCYCDTYPLRRQFGDSPADISPHLYADVDFAGDQEIYRSRTGVQLCLKGPHTFCPIIGNSKKQDCVSHSIPESEIVAAALAIRREGLPSTYLWSLLLKGQQSKDF